MSEQEFTGHIRAMRSEADWLGAEDLIDCGDMPFQIAKVCHDPDLKIGGSKSKDKHYLRLLDRSGRECTKKLLINARRRKMLGALYGGKVEAWRGKWIWLYVEKVKAIGGGETLGYSIRPRTDVPKAAESAAAEPEAKP